MGALHEGHLSLIRRSLKENDLTCVSIFVNRTQFNDKKDLINYPRPLKKDIVKLRKEKVDFLFLPAFAEIYPDKYRFRILENRKSRLLCGAHRPGHFEGVLTVVMKLLNIINPDRAYFGEKDFQQYMLVKEMTEAFFMKTKIISCPIVRETSGLAASSRNRLLGPKEKPLAPFLYKALKMRKSDEDVKKYLENRGFKVDYVERKWGRRLAAAWLGKVRLIDNVKI